MNRSKPAGLGSRWFGPERCEFLVWAPSARKVEMRLVSPKKSSVPMETDGSGYHWAVLSGIKPGTQYLYRLDGKAQRPDPASRRQPRGVHGPSAVVDPAFDWHDRKWKGLPLERYVIYELHVGAFSKAGTFAGVIPQLDTLTELGVTTLCLMPVAQFPGERNWGYDGVYPFAVQESYGGAADLKRLIDAAHQRGLAVMLDVVYNHLGPEGNYLRDFGPYFTSSYKTPWGEAINLDGPGSDEVRRLFIESARQWVEEFHVDAFRLDSINHLSDFSARPFLEELTQTVHELGRGLRREVAVIAESSLNDPRVIRPSEDGGLGCDAQWCKEFHHSLHTALTDERSSYYIDYSGLADLAQSYRGAYVYTGQYSAYRGRRHGRDCADRPAKQFLVFAQDHDEVGNRPQGDRLATWAGLEAAKLCAAAVALSPYVPLLFMGEEYGENAPFLFFTSYADRRLAEAVRRGRREAFISCRGAEKVSDPNAASTFLRSKLDQGLRKKGRHALLQNFYRRLYALRREHPALAQHDRNNIDVSLHEKNQAIVVRRHAGSEEAFFVLHFGQSANRLRLELPGGGWAKLLDSAQPQWGGPGSPAVERLAGGPAEMNLAPLCVVAYGRSTH